MSSTGISTILIGNPNRKANRRPSIKPILPKIISIAGRFINVSSNHFTKLTTYPTAQNVNRKKIIAPTMAVVYELLINATSFKLVNLRRSSRRKTPSVPPINRKQPCTIRFNISPPPFHYYKHFS